MNIAYDWAARPAYDALSAPDRQQIDRALANFRVDDQSRVRRIQAGQRKGLYVLNPGPDLRLILRVDEQGDQITVAEIVRPEALSSYT